jgi:hypothetical protein
VTLSVLANVIIIVFESKDGEHMGSSKPKCDQCPSKEFIDVSEIFFVAFFSIEFALRLIAAEQYWVQSEDFSASESYDNKSPHGQALGATLSLSSSERAFLKDPFAYFDFLSFFPGLLGLLWPSMPIATLSFLRKLRLLKIFRRAVGIKLVFKTLRNSTEALLVPLLFLTTLIFFFSVIIYALEGCDDVNKCDFDSLYGTMYFIVVTVTTTGYGDKSPTLDNYASMFVTVVLMILGISCEPHLLTILLRQ